MFAYDSFFNFNIFPNIFNYLLACRNCKYILKNNFSTRRERRILFPILNFQYYVSNKFGGKIINDVPICILVVQEIRILFYILWIIMNPITKDEITQHMSYRIFIYTEKTCIKPYIYFRSQLKKSHEQLHFTIILHIKHCLSIMFYYGWRTF